MGADPSSLTGAAGQAKDGGVWRQGPMPVCIAAALVLALSVPVIAWGEWMPLDLPQIYGLGATLGHAWTGIFNPYNGSGRYFPMYWVYNGLQYPLFGDAVAPWFLVQALVLLATALLLGKLLRELTGSRWLGTTFVAVFYLSTPLAENLSTLGKAEPVMLLLVASILLVFHRSRLQGPGAWCAGGVICALFVLALWTKETSLILLAFAGAGAVFAWAARVLRPWRAAPPATMPYLRLLAALLAGVAVSRIPFLVYAKTASGSTYTEYAITPGLVLANARFYLLQQPDVVVFGVLAVVMLPLLVRHAGAGRRLSQPAEADKLVFVLAVAAMACAYWLTFQVWRWPLTYYMLLPGALFRFAALYAAFMLHRVGALGPRARHALLAVGGVALAWAAAATCYIVGTQIAYSRIYTEAMRQVQQFAPGGRLLIDSYAYYSEQVHATQMLLRNQLHLTTQVVGIADAIHPPAAAPEVLQALKLAPTDDPAVVLQPGEYLLTFTGKALAHWLVRGVAPYHLMQSPLERQDAGLQMVAQRSVSVPAVFLTHGTWRPSAEGATYGYRLQRVAAPARRLAWTGRFDDGWVGEHATLSLDPDYGQPVAFSIRIMPYTIPATVRITRDGQLLKELKITRPEAIIVQAGPAPQARTQFTIQVSRSFVPREQDVNDDVRRLAALVSLVPTEKRP